jgi:hypothetical protein
MRGPSASCVAWTAPSRLATRAGCSPLDGETDIDVGTVEVVGVRRYERPVDLVDAPHVAKLKLAGHAAKIERGYVSWSAFAGRPARRRASHPAAPQRLPSL